MKILRVWQIIMKNLLSSQMIGELFWRSHAKVWPVYRATAALFALVASILFLFKDSLLATAITRLVALPVPVLSIVFSGIYMPFIIDALREQSDRRVLTLHRYSTMLFSNIISYTIVGGLSWLVYLLYLESGVTGRFVMLLLGAFAFIPVLIVLAATPFIMFAYSYEPTTRMSTRRIIGHIVRITRAEFVFYPYFFIALWPLAPCIYFIPYYLFSFGIVTQVYQRLLMHLLSFLYWEYGWALFARYYQMRKSHYY